MEAVKRCSRCRNEKPISAFPRRSISDSRPLSRCKQCYSELNTLLYRRMHPGNRHRTPKLSESQWQEIRQRGQLVCSRCHTEKPLADFPVRRSCGKDYFARDCRPCRKKRKAQWCDANQQRLWDRAVRYKCPQYGITPDDYRQMLARQKYCCALCERPLPMKWQTIDHDHSTGVVRGIVHRACNLVIGNASEDIEVLHRAIAYLQRHKSGQVPVAIAPDAIQYS